MRASNRETIEVIMQTLIEESCQELYGWYAIQVFARPLSDAAFEMHGTIRHPVKNPQVQEDLPYEYPFDTRGQKYPSADAALRAGLVFARKKIDALK
jgi:hypothetical protein